MGFSTIIDIVGSVLIGGTLMLILWRLNNATSENTYNYSGELSLQQNLATVAMVIEYDFRKIGYCSDWNKIPDPTKAIVLADSNKIKFLTDVQSDGVVDTMYYYLGPTSELTQTENPRDRILYRLVNNETPKGANMGVTQFKMVYFNALGDTISFPITNPGEITSMEINVTVENTAGYDQKYSSAFWRQIRLVARNLRNR
jgi:type II secretory pathway component PulJ